MNTFPDAEVTVNEPLYNAASGSDCDPVEPVTPLTLMFTPTEKPCSLGSSNSSTVTAVAV